MTNQQNKTALPKYMKTLGQWNRQKRVEGLVNYKGCGCPHVATPIYDKNWPEFFVIMNIDVSSMLKNSWLTWVQCWRIQHGTHVNHEFLKRNNKTFHGYYKLCTYDRGWIVVRIDHLYNVWMFHGLKKRELSLKRTQIFKQFENLIATNEYLSVFTFG